ncbi:2-phosphosulfolactate phosphatase [Carboxydothermus pertinax]|uniref:Probable 2-phosphosulfolactate phosphatase n=1 Tax=Carboxydothermus pertinax TaxID=870242 RepID=A0A1L8CUJ8_9THEO|nr:2-phosphosulfolactate phosphatase [Carboxydothermus pertinax]GAV22596.1 2-phosphosulfolactate phosphatase [Carboxydothermus pertinax]
MKIDVLFYPEKLKNVEDKVVVVLDVLRATTTIATALAAGAKEVYPVSSIREAFSLKKKIPGALVGGERGGIKVPGFDLGNSPLEYQNLSGKTIILSSTNGTKALTKASQAKNLIAGSIINAKAVANYLGRLNLDVIFLPSGTDFQFSLEDFAGAGYIISLLAQQKKIYLSDQAFVSLKLAQNNSPEEVLTRSFHGQRLINLGFQKDVEYCASLNLLDVVPVGRVSEGRLVIESSRLFR